MNVALGGTLYQDLASERPAGIDHTNPSVRHGVRVEGDSLLYRTIHTARAAVNSRHHQAIRDLAPGLRATAWADDGLIEAVEPVNGPAWMLAVQWHPEDDVEDGLFAGFGRALG